MEDERQRDEASGEQGWAEKMAATGDAMQKTGASMMSCGCAIFALVIIVIFGWIALQAC